MRNTPVDQFDLQGNFIRTFASSQQAAAAVGVVKSGISSAITNFSVCAGYKWKHSLSGPAYARPYYFPGEEPELLRRIAENKGRIIQTISKFSFATTDQLIFEDIYQDVIVNLWEGYPTFRNNKGRDFGLWIYSISKWAALKYYRDHIKKNNRIIHEESLISDIPLIEDESNTEFTIALAEFIANLGDYDSLIMQSYLDLGDQRLVALKLGTTRSAINNRMSRIYKLIRSQKHIYFSDFRILKRLKFIIKEGVRSNANNVNEPQHNTPPAAQPPAYEPPPGLFRLPIQLPGDGNRVAFFEYPKEMNKRDFKVIAKALTFVASSLIIDEEDEDYEIKIEVTESKNTKGSTNATP